MLQAIRQSPNYKWWAFTAIGIGTFISVVDTGRALVALPDIESHFNTDLATVQCVVVGYALAIVCLPFPMGRLGAIPRPTTLYLRRLLPSVLPPASSRPPPPTSSPTLRPDHRRPATDTPPEPRENLAARRAHRKASENP